MLKRCFILLLCAALAAPALAGGYGGRYHYGGHYRHHNGGDGDALLAGLVIGGLIGYFIGDDRHYRRDAYTSHRYRHHAYYRDYDYYDHGYQEDVYYREYVPVEPRRIVIREQHPEFPGHTCRMTREYTTTVEIDGRDHEAYGTKCLTADGSWVLGRPKLVPQFD